MSVNTVKNIFKICFDVMNYKFPVMGFNVSLFGVMMFLIVSSIVLGSILKLFNKD